MSKVPSHYLLVVFPSSRSLPLPRPGCDVTVWAPFSGSSPFCDTIHSHSIIINVAFFSAHCVHTNVKMWSLPLPVLLLSIFHLPGFLLHIFFRSFSSWLRQTTWLYRRLCNAVKCELSDDAAKSSSKFIYNEYDELAGDGGALNVQGRLMCFISRNISFSQLILLCSAPRTLISVEKLFYGEIAFFLRSDLGRSGEHSSGPSRGRHCMLY